MPVRKCWVFASAIALFLVFAGAAAPTEAPPNIVLITIDTLRADRLNSYGYEAIRTPETKRLADEGVVFENAFTETPWTLPALTSVMTGLYPAEHGVRTWHDRIGADRTTLAELLKRRGYATAAIVGSYALDRGFGFSQGFDSYDDDMNTALVSDGDVEEVPEGSFDGSADQKNHWLLRRERADAYRPDDQVADRAIEWLDERGEANEPFFLWIHFFGPHEREKMLSLPPEERKAYLAKQIARYDPAVEVVDREVGRLLDRLRKDDDWARTAVILHSDHGQSLNEHHFFGHGFELYDTNVHVPMIVRLPNGERSGERVSRLVRNLDIFPTVLNLAGLDVPANTAGSDLLASGEGAEPHVFLASDSFIGLSAKDMEVDGETRRVGKSLRGVRMLDWKLINRDPAPSGVDADEPLPDEFVAKGRKSRLYDMTKDPREFSDLAGERPELVGQLQSMVDGHTAKRRASGSARELDAATRERLNALGYTVD